MKSWSVTEEQQTLRMGEEGKGEMHCQSHGQRRWQRRGLKK